LGVDLGQENTVVARDRRRGLGSERRLGGSKSILDCGVWSNLSIEYPARDKLGYDPLVVRVAASLKPGHGYDNPNCP
jgi:hypothetical protein